MIPNEMKSWREVMDDVARLTKERDEARCEVERLRNLYDDAKQSANAWRSLRGISERDHELERQLAEAHAEISRMREVESAELRAARDDAIRLGNERNDARAERDEARGEAALCHERQRNDWAEFARQWKIADPFLNAETNGKTWGEIIKLYGKKSKAADAEVARLRASQNERAIEELEDQVKRVNLAATNWAKNRDGGVDRHEADRCDARVRQLTGVAFYMGQRIDALRAEQAAAPAPVTPSITPSPMDTASNVLPKRVPRFKFDEEPVITEPDAPQRPSVEELRRVDYYQGKPVERELLFLIIETLEALAARGGA